MSLDYCQFHSACIDWETDSFASRPMTWGARTCPARRRGGRWSWSSPGWCAPSGRARGGCSPRPRPSCSCGPAARAGCGGACGGGHRQRPVCLPCRSWVRDRLVDHPEDGEGVVILHDVDDLHMKQLGVDEHRYGRVRWFRDPDTSAWQHASTKDRLPGTPGAPRRAQAEHPLLPGRGR